MIDLMLGQIAHMEENISQLDKNDLRFVAHQMELERIKFIVTSYLRCRVQKIETFTRHILMEEDERPLDKRRLTSDERRFAESHAALVKQHFDQVAVQHMPQNLQEQSSNEIVTPNLMSHIFLRANETIPAVIVGVNDEEVDMEKDSLHLMPYKMASQLVLDGKVQLI